jgi:arylsulfatase A-like enzyme
VADDHAHGPGREGPPPPRRVSRRSLLRAAGMGAAALPLTGVLGCTPADSGPSAVGSPAVDAPPATPAAPSATPSPAPAPAPAPASGGRAMHPEFMRLPRLPQLPRPGAGNGMHVIVVVVDSVRRDHIGVYGSRDVRTPAIDELARSSTRFTQARPEAMPTVQVRRCVHTGMRTFPTRGWWPQKGDGVRMPGWQRIPEEQVTLAEVLAAAGYFTAFISDTPHLFKPSMNFTRGFQYWDYVRGQPASGFRGGAVPRRSEQDHAAPRVFTAAMDLLAEAEQLGPFLLVVDSYDPHEPWDPPASWIERYGDRDFDGPEPSRPDYGWADYLTDAQLARMNVLYRAELSMVDAWLGRFVDEVDRRGLLDDTLLVFLSDHGVLLGEHNLVGKPVSESLWPEITDIPLLVRHPGHATARTDDRFVSTHDVVPTILGALGIAPPFALPGLDLTPILAGRPQRVARRDHLTLGYAANAMIRTERWALTTTSDGSTRRLFDVRADPGFTRDVAAGNPMVVDRLVARLERDAGGPLPVHDGDAVTARLGERT